MDFDRHLRALATILFATLATIVSAQATSPPIVAFLALASRDEAQVDALTRGLVENGLVPGHSVRLELRFADGDPERARSHIAELVARGAKVFVTGGPNVARMVQQQSKDVAIVVASLESLRVAGVAGTIARPDGNITGFATQADELIGKWFELLAEIMPGIKRIAMISNPENRNQAERLAAARKAAEQLGLSILVVEISNETMIESKLQQVRAAGVEAAIIPRDFLFESIRPRLVSAALAARLPSMYDEGTFVKLGGLIAYSPNRPDLFRRSAAYVARLLDGARPADLPIQQPTKFELVVNLKTAKTLGLTIPPSILIRADEVIE